MIAAQHLKELRLKHNYTQDYIAYELDIAQKTYSNIENGKTKITIEHLDILARIYKTNSTDLLKHLTEIDTTTIYNIKKEHENLSEDALYNGINVNLSHELITQLKARINNLNELLMIKDQRIKELESKNQ